MNEFDFFQLESSLVLGLLSYPSHTLLGNPVGSACKTYPESKPVVITFIIAILDLDYGLPSGLLAPSLTPAKSIFRGIVVTPLLKPFSGSPFQSKSLNPSSLA